jgi:hypothetical protein
MKKCFALALAIGALVHAAPSGAQQGKDRTIEQYECRDIMRDSGANRDVAIAFLHGYLLGKSGGSKFNLDTIQKQTDLFLEHCLLNPRQKAVDAMMSIMK